MTLKSIAFALATLGIAMTASAQTTSTYRTPEEEQINVLVQRLRNDRQPETTLKLDLQGNDVIGDGVWPFHTELFWHMTDPDALTLPGRHRTIRVHLRHIRYDGETPKVAYEAIGDGRTLWVYNHDLRTYSATVYGPQVANPEDGSDRNFRDSQYHSRLLNALIQAVPVNAPASYSVRMLREIYGGLATASTAESNIAYRSWMPDRVPRLLSSPEQDPVLDERFRTPYAPTPSTAFVLYDGSARRRSVVFELARPDEADPSQDFLAAIHFADTTPQARNPRVLFWTLTPSANADVSTARFVPFNQQEVPNYRPVVSSVRVKG